MNLISSYIIAGSAAGIITGLFGTGGGMIFIPVLSFLRKDSSPFKLSVAVMFPICAITAYLSFTKSAFDVSAFLPYLLGGAAGGLLSTKVKVSTVILHIIFGGFLVWGGIRFLCS